MNKSQLIKAVAEKSELSQKQVAETWSLIEDTILNTLATGEKVQLSGFGTFEVRERAERKGRNPKTGEVVSVPACKYLAFVSAKSVKENLKVDICSKCHPFFTGKQKFVDAGGRVDKFKKKFNLQ